MSTWSVTDFINNTDVTQNFRIFESVTVYNIRIRCIFVGPLVSGATFTFSLGTETNIYKSVSITSDEINSQISGNQLIDIVLPFDGVRLDTNIDGSREQYRLTMNASNYFYDDNPSGFNFGYLAPVNRTIQDNTYSPRFGTVITEDTENGTDAESANFTPIWIEIEGLE